MYGVVQVGTDMAEFQKQLFCSVLEQKQRIMHKDVLHKEILILDEPAFLVGFALTLQV